MSSTLHTHTHTFMHAEHRAEPSSLLYYCGQLVSGGEREKARKKGERERERDEFVVTALVDSAF